MMNSEDLLQRSALSPVHVLAPVTALVLVAAAILAGADASTTWYIIRGTGIIAYVLLSLSVVSGLLITQRATPAGQARLDLFELHTFLSLLAIAFGSIHGVALLFDSYIGFSPAQVLVPFTSIYRPLSVGPGVLGLYSAGLIYASFWAKRYIGYRTWRALHYGTFATFVLVTLHGYFSGTDSGESWMAIIYAAATAIVVGLTCVRIMASKTTPRRPAVAQ